MTTTIARRVFALFAASISLAACAHLSAGPVPVQSTAEEPMYASFFVLEGNSSGNATLDARLREDVAMGLVDKGLIRTSPDAAQAVVVVHTATAAKHTRDALYQGWGGWDWRGASGALSENDYYKPGTLVVDIFDAWSKHLLWHRATPMDARRLLKNFPASGYQPAPAHEPTARGESMRIFFAPRPALLVQVDGEPRYAPVSGTELERVTNTPAYLVRNASGLHYLKIGRDWMEADDLFGSWSRAGVPPDGSDFVIDPLAPYDGEPEMPTIYISTRPAQLIVTDGDPEYVPVNGSGLMYLKNTQATVFREATDQQLYVHVREGWFRAWTTNGPWQPIAEGQLPADLIWMRVAPPGGLSLTEQ